MCSQVSRLSPVCAAIPLQTEEFTAYGVSSAKVLFTRLQHAEETKKGECLVRPYGAGRKEFGGIAIASAMAKDRMESGLHVSMAVMASDMFDMRRCAKAPPLRAGSAGAIAVYATSGLLATGNGHL